MEAYAERQIPRTLGEDFFGRIAGRSVMRRHALPARNPAPADRQPMERPLEAGDASAAHRARWARPAVAPRRHPAFWPPRLLRRGDRVRRRGSCNTKAPLGKAICARLAQSSEALVLGAFPTDCDVSFYRIAPGSSIHVTPAVLRWNRGKPQAGMQPSGWIRT